MLCTKGHLLLPNVQPQFILIIIKMYLHTNNEIQRAYCVKAPVTMFITLRTVIF